MNAIYYYGYFPLVWYMTVLFAFVCVYGFIFLKSSFRKLASLTLLLSSALPALLVCGKLTEDLKTTQAMAIALIIIQTAVVAIGLAVVRETIPLKLFKNIQQKGINKEKSL